MSGARRDMSGRASLELAIAAVEEALDAVPAARPGEKWSDWVRSAREHENALKRAVSQLRRTGARMHLSPTHSRMELAGVSASCTTGGRGLLEVWLEAARLRLRQQEARSHFHSRRIRCSTSAKKC